MRVVWRSALVGLALTSLLLAACGEPDEQLGQPGDQVPPEQECVTAFAEIEPEVESLAAAGELLDGTILRCDSFEEWRGTLEDSEIEVDHDPASFVEARCETTDELAGSPVCAEAAD